MAILSYTDAKNFLNGRLSRKFCNNTYIIDNGDVISVKLHNTYVVNFRPNGSVVLNSGGWRTVTTKNRINRFIYPKVYQKGGEWFIYYPSSGVTEEFEDYMEIGGRS